MAGATCLRACLQGMSCAHRTSICRCSHPCQAHPPPSTASTFLLTRTPRLHSQQAVLGQPPQQLQGQASSQWLFLGPLLKHPVSRQLKRHSGFFSSGPRKRPAVSSAAGTPAGPVAAPTACIAVASVEAAEVSTAPAKTLDGAPAASSAAAGLMPASAAPAKTVGHGPSKICSSSVVLRSGQPLPLLSRYIL